MINLMAGQWRADIHEELNASIRLDLEDRGRGCFGHAYLFYTGSDIPGFLFHIRLPQRAPFKTKLTTIYLMPQGGIMSPSERAGAEQFMTEKYNGPLPPEIEIELSLEESSLKVVWQSADG